MKVNINKASFTLTSDINAKDICTLQEFKPDALVLKDDKENPVFRVAHTTYHYDEFGSVTKSGIVFDDADAENKATVTVLFSGNLSQEARKNSTEKILYLVSENLAKITKQIEKAIKEFDAASNKIKEVITITE